MPHFKSPRTTSGLLQCRDTCITALRRHAHLVQECAMLPPLKGPVAEATTSSYRSVSAATQEPVAEAVCVRARLHEEDADVVRTRLPKHVHLVAIVKLQVCVRRVRRWHRPRHVHDLRVVPPGWCPKRTHCEDHAARAMVPDRAKHVQRRAERHGVRCHVDERGPAHANGRELRRRRRRRRARALADGGRQRRQRRCARAVIAR
mmetsp:Transcript_18018/g.53939  ORF Transcript_18018/g.53939 Transcript_18018/m.53939 type:complete len:204 (+) Transcript_18018:594-1205(+)